MVVATSAWIASAEPGIGCTLGCSACEASSGLATSRPWNWVRNFAAASRIALNAAIPSSSSPLPIFGAGPLP